MLIARKMQELDFPALMEIYIEGNVENGRELYPDLSEFEQIRQAEENFHNYLSDDFFRKKDAFYAVLTEEDRYISALRIEPYLDGVLLEALETRPEMRGMGYAKKLVREVLVFLKSTDYKYVYSHISKRNTPSLKVHEACGFTHFLDHAAYIDGSVSANAVTMRIEI